MLNRTSVIFCSVTFATAIAVCAVGFRYAAMPAETLAASRTPAPPEKLPDVEITGFGKVSVIELVGYYVENPPSEDKPAGPGSARPGKRFGGC